MIDNTASTSSHAANSPPKAPLAFRIGVVGHRPNRLGHADLNRLGERLREIVATIRHEVEEHYRTHQSLYAAAAPVVRVLSPLAEGVDRLFAEQGLATGCELTAVLPFSQAEFESDFAPGKALEPDSVSRFRRLVDQAKAVFQLDGSRTEESRAYHIAGTVVLNQSDLLVVVWDGERKNLRGGTEETFDDALERGVPIVWINAHAPHHWRIVTEPLRTLDEITPGVRAALTKSADLAELRSMIRKLIDLPAVPNRKNAEGHPAGSPGQDDPLAAIQTYFHERQVTWNFAFWWKWFRDLIGDGKFKAPVLEVQPDEEAVENRWPRDRSTPVAATIDRLRPFYAWPDELADRYADGYRSAFVMAFFSAGLAVALALGPLGLGWLDHGGESDHPQPAAHHLGEMLFSLGELCAIFLILYLVFRARRGRWHQRWLDYRLLAEMVRHQRLIVHLGGQRAAPSVPEHWLAYGDLAASWMAWQARAVERALGLPAAIVDRAYLAACVDDLRRQLQEQIDFHVATSTRSHRIEHRLHWLEIALLMLTILCCGQHLLQGFWHDWPQLPGPALTFCCGFFPAAGAALAGISNQGEFRRIALRSNSMSERLEQHLNRLNRLEARLQRPGVLRQQLSAELAGLASETARTMVNEVLDWRVIFQDRPPRTA